MARGHGAADLGDVHDIGGSRRGLNAGADSYLVQPAEPLELAAAINALLRIRRSEDALRALNATLDQRVQERTAELAEANGSSRRKSRSGRRPKRHWCRRRRWRRSAS